MAIAVSGYAVRPVRKGTWTKSMPTDVLLAVQRTLGEWTTRHVRAELAARFDRGELSDRQKRWLAAAAVQAMADDREEWNALWAMDILSVLGDSATGPLEAGLNSNDWQQRQLCADVLRNRYVPGWYEVGPFEKRVPPQRLIEVSVEGLANDGLPFGPANYWGTGHCAETWVCNARAGLTFLARCGPEAERALRSALGSEDEQQRFLAACAAGYAADTGLAEEAIAILLPHLHRDQIDCNAKLATGALFALGQPARQAIESLAASSKESQERSIARRILLEWSGPAATQAEYESRRANCWLWSEDPFDDVRSDQVPGFHPFPNFQ